MKKQVTSRKRFFTRKHVIINLNLEFKLIPIKINKKFIELKHLELFTDKSVKQHLAQFTNDICIQCLTNHKEIDPASNTNVIFNLPCGCRIFSERCLVDYLKHCFHNNNQKKGNILIKKRNLLLLLICIKHYRNEIFV